MDFQTLQEEKRNGKRAIYFKGMQLENLFKQIVTNTLYFEWFRRNMSSYPNQGKMPFLNISDSSVEF